MQKLISELTRLFLPDGAPPPAWTQRLAGLSSPALPLTNGDGQVRALVIRFNRTPGSGEASHWTRLCAVANALQAQLGLPAPAVSISGDGYCLWLSFETPTPPAQAKSFLALLHQAYMPEVDYQAGTAAAPVELPPCLHQRSGKWAAFIHPDLGASFADEPGLDMTPPPAGQAALLEGLHSISPQQFQHALQQLQHMQESVSAPAPASASATHAGAPEGLLLKDATLEDIVRFLHARNIEPTFRHLLPT
jgi:hypothetical protein